MSKNDKAGRLETWVKPEVRKIKAGSAEAGPSGGPDGGPGGNNKS